MIQRYNDTSKAKAGLVSFLAGGMKMVKLTIFDMRHFLRQVDVCRGEVWMLYPEGGRTDLRDKGIQKYVMKEHGRNGNCSRLNLQIPDARDHMRLVLTYAGDC